MTTKVEIAHREGSAHRVRVQTIGVKEHPATEDAPAQVEQVVTAEQVLAPGDRVGFYVYAGQRLIIDEVE